MTPEEEKLFSIFFPFACPRQMKMLETRNPLVHYTSADAAMKIISQKRFWMREASCMNDKAEMHHGKNCLINAYSDGLKEKLESVLNPISPEIVKKLESYYDGWMNTFMTDTYLSCFSEHDEENEGGLGRLSMWRAYSKNSGVALVLNSPIFFSESEYFNGLYTSPVAYLDDQSFKGEMLGLVSGIENNLDMVSKLEPDIIVDLLFKAFLFATTCTKHPGFAEEKEWRVTYCPKILSADCIEKGFETIHGIPQIIYKIPIEAPPEKSLDDLDLDKFLRYVIIGPTEYPLAMYKAFANLLRDKGVTNPESRVRVSHIPLRT